MTIDNPLGICFLVPFGTLLGTCSQNVAMLLITEEDVPEFGGLYSAVFVLSVRRSSQVAQSFASYPRFDVLVSVEGFGVAFFKK
jgi:hypothetical protein